MASALAIDAMVVEGTGPGRFSHAATNHAGVYRMASVEGTDGVSGMLFLREDRACVLRLVLPTDGDRKLIRLMRGIWWPVPVGVKVLTSDGSVGVWAAKRNSVKVRFPMAAPGVIRTSGTVTEIKFVRVR